MRNFLFLSIVTSSFLTFFSQISTAAPATDPCGVDKFIAESGPANTHANDSTNQLISLYQKGLQVESCFAAALTKDLKSSNLDLQKADQRLGDKLFGYEIAIGGFLVAKPDYQLAPLAAPAPASKPRASH